MEKIKKNIGSFLALVSGLLMLGAVKIWAPVCNKQLELYWKNGDFKQMPMKCFYTEKVVIYLSVILVALAVMAIIKEKQPVLIPILVGIFLYISTTGGALGIGLCRPGGDMPCTVTRVWIYFTAVAAILSGVINFIASRRASN